MTKIIVDKETAIKAVLKFFNIPITGTEPMYYKDVKLGKITPTLPVMVFFDFEDGYRDTHKTDDYKETGCQK